MSRNDASSETKTTIRSLPRKILWATLAAVVGGSIAAVLSAYSHLIQSEVESFWTDRSATGPYVAVVRGYQHPPIPEGKDPERQTYEYSVDLKKAGTLIFGEMTYVGDKGKQTYKLSGFIRDQFVSIAYEDEDRANSGTGTFSLQKSGEHAMVGIWAGLECKGDERLLLECPAVFFRSDKNRADDYREYVYQDCRVIPIKARNMPATSVPSVNSSALRCASADANAK